MVSRSAGKIAGVSTYLPITARSLLASAAGGFSTRPLTPVQLATRLGDLGAAVPRDLVVGHSHQRKDGRPELLMRVPELAQHRRLGQGQVVGKHAEEGPIPHRARGAEHRVAETARRGLTGHGDPAQVPGPAHGLELCRSCRAPRAGARAGDRGAGARPAPPCPRPGRGRSRRRRMRRPPRPPTGSPGDREPGATPWEAPWWQGESASPGPRPGSRMVASPRRRIVARRDAAVLPVTLARYA